MLLATNARRRRLATQYHRSYYQFHTQNRCQARLVLGTHGHRRVQAKGVVGREVPFDSRLGLCDRIVCRQLKLLVFYRTVHSLNKEVVPTCLVTISPKLRTKICRRRDDVLVRESAILVDTVDVRLPNVGRGFIQRHLPERGFYVDRIALGECPATRSVYDDAPVSKSESHSRIHSINRLNVFCALDVEFRLHVLIYIVLAIPILRAKPPLGRLGLRAWHLRENILLPNPRGLSVQEVAKHLRPSKRSRQAPSNDASHESLMDLSVCPLHLVDVVSTDANHFDMPDDKFGVGSVGHS